MAQFVSRAENGREIRIAYDDEGEGRPILLIHGFASNRQTNWRGPGWYSALTKAGRRVVALDCRGHGESSKPRDPADYDEGKMTADALAVLDRLGIRDCDVMGYSMGGFLTLRLLHDHGARFGKAILAGIGENYFRTLTANAGKIVEGLLALSPSEVTDTVALQFRLFAQSLNNDMRALAACMTRPRKMLSGEELAAIRNETLVVCGELDVISGRPEPLAGVLGNARAVIVPKRDHMLTVGDRGYKDAVLKFLG